MHNHYSHLADSVDELKEAGVKGGHAKRLVARCSASETGRSVQNVNYNRELICQHDAPARGSM